MFWVFKKKKAKEQIDSIGDGFRINRIIRSEWNAGRCEKLNNFHHYAVLIDGQPRRYGIAEIYGAIKALEEHESQLAS